MTPADALSRRVQDKQAELADARRRVDIIAAELSVWEEALRLVAPSVNAGLPQKTPSLFPAIEVNGSRSTRGMKGSWRAIMQSVGTLFPDSFLLDELERAAQVANHPVNRNTARSQMSNYTLSGIVERVKEGQFRITDAGRNAAGILSNNSTQDASNETVVADEEAEQSAA